MINLTVPSLSALVAWLRGPRGELLVVALITIAALTVRVVHLADVPPGLHGDEAWTGMRADDILRGAGIPAFDRIHGLGQPSGMEYLTAAFIQLFGSSVLTIRLPMALLGAATVPLTYYLIKALFNDRTTAVIGATLLAFMGWHIHYSRIALPPAGWPFFEVLACLLFVLAMRSRAWWLFALAGLALGLGVYTYSSYNVFALAFVAFTGYWLLTQQIERSRTLLLSLGVMFAVALLAALPMVEYIASNDDIYFQYPRQISLFRTDEYKAADSPLERYDVIGDAGKAFVKRVVFDADTDFSDGAGSGPMLNATFSVLLGLGVLLAVWRWREPGAALPLLIVLVLPWAGILTVGGGIVRRAMGVTPFLAMLAALPLAELVRRAQPARALVRGAAYFIVAGAIVSVAVLDLRAYFGIFPGSSVGQYVFAPELVAASQYMDALPDETLVYFYSDRWSFNYETRRYLAPGMDGQDRSREFGSLSFYADRSQDTVMVFMGTYLGQLEEAQRLYPDGEALERRSDSAVQFQALFLPAGGPPAADDDIEPPPTLGGDLRDARRVQDFNALQVLLEAYKQRHGAYPDNDGALQTLCVYPEDTGCALQEIAETLPEDPLGDATTNGYFYASDGATYTIYAQRESSTLPQCDEHPGFLDKFPGVLCVRGP